MPDLATQIQSLSGNYLNRLADLHDDHNFTAILWRTQLVRVQRYGETLSITNPLTGTVTDGAVLASKARTSLERMAVRSFKDIVAQFELFVADVLSVWLPQKTELIQEKAIDVATLLKCKTLQDAQTAAVEEAIASTIADKMYGKPEKWFNYLKRNLGARFVASDEDSFFELKARRDVLEHNNGKVEAIYVEKSKEAAKYAVGDQIVLSDADVDDAYTKTRDLVLVATTSILASLRGS